MNISSSCIKIEQVHGFKYLGLIISLNLSWGEQITKIKTRIIGYIMTRMFYFLYDFGPGKVLILLYHSFVGSRLGYALSCCGDIYYKS